MMKFLGIIIYLINLYLFMGFSEFLTGIYSTNLPNIIKYDTYVYMIIFIICIMYLLLRIIKKRSTILIKYKSLLLFGVCVLLIIILNTNNKESILFNIMNAFYNFLFYI